MAEHAHMHRSLAGTMGGPLLQFFNTEMGSKATERLKRIALFLNQDTSNVNLPFHCEDPVLHLLQGKLQDVATDLLVAFVKPSVISEAKNLFKIEHDRQSKQKDRKELVIGEATREYLKKCMLAGLSKKSESAFFEGMSVWPIVFLKCVLFLKRLQ